MQWRDYYMTKTQQIIFTEGELLQPHHPTPSFDIESRCHITVSDMATKR